MSLHLIYRSRPQFGRGGVQLQHVSGAEQVEIDDVDFPLVGFCFAGKRKFIRSTSFLLAPYSPHTRFIDGHSNFVPDMRVLFVCMCVCVRTCILGLVYVLLSRIFSTLYHLDGLYILDLHSKGRDDVSIVKYNDVDG